jgi:hypothetical protein
VNLWVTEEMMVSEDTGHTAHRILGGWALSWLPGRVLDRNQAVTGMVLAEMADSGDLKAGDRRLPLLSCLAAELGLTGLDAAERAALPPADTSFVAVTTATADVAANELGQVADAEWVDER